MNPTGSQFFSKSYLVLIVQKSRGGLH